jgi:hypothetical protein
MRIPQAAGLGLLALGLATVARAAPEAGSPPETTGAPPPAASASRPAPPARRDGKSALRRLDDIHIEGEIPVPQVLFVSGRDQHRYLDFQHRRYLKTSLAIGQETVLPSRITWIGPTPVPERKEIAP